MGLSFESIQLFLRNRRSEPEKYQNLAQDIGAMPVVGGIKMENAIDICIFFKYHYLIYFYPHPDLLPEGEGGAGALNR